MQRNSEIIIKKYKQIIMNKKEFLPNPPKEIYLDIDNLDYSVHCNNMAPEFVFNNKESELI